MDLNLLRTAVFEKTGIKVDTQDPIFALVALHETVLADSVAQQLNLIDDATARLQQQSSDLLATAEQVRVLLQAAGYTIDATALGPAPTQVNHSSTTARHGSAASARLWFGLSSQMILAACVLAALITMLTVGVQWLFFLRTH